MAKNAKKLLLVSYYWFPDGGTGMYRISKFAKYLKRLGWEITVLTASQGEHVTDDDFNVVRVKGFKLSALWGSRKSVVKKEAGFNPSVFYQKNPSLKDRLLIWARLNLLVPDAKIGWLKSAAKKGISLHAEHAFDALLSTSPPPTTNLVAQRIAQKTQLPWVADFRDPWTQIYYYEAFPQGRIAARLNRNLERKVVQDCDRLICVNDDFFDFPFPATKYQQITNGFDPEDFKLKVTERDEAESKFTIRYLGTLKLNQFSSGLLEALQKLGAKYPGQIQIDFVGNIDPQYQQKIQDSTSDISFNFPGLLPHQKAMELCQNADLLLLIIGSGASSKMVFSTKLFEYIYAQKPVLAIAHPEGAAASIIRETEAGETFEHGNGTEIFNFLEMHYAAYQRGEKPKAGKQQVLQKYSFEALTLQLHRILDEIS